MDAHSLHVLEYHKVIEQLAGHCSNGIGREFALELAPLPYIETVHRRLQETRECRALRDQGGGLPLGGIRDVREAVDRARLEMRLTGLELLDIHSTIAAARGLRMYLLNRRETAPLMAESAANIPVLQPVETRIEGAVQSGGELKDSASPVLARLRSQLRMTHSRLMDRLQGMLGSDKYRTYIQEPVITLREGRYCIPVKSEFARAFGGIVHDASASGATVFLEPTTSVELGNELKQLTSQEEQEVDRIFRDLSRLVGSYSAELSRMLSVLGHLDVANAKALLAEEMSAIEPSVNGEGHVRLRKARHPLLQGDVVPIDVEVGGAFTELLITGPNTGGKTVTLKTVGLMTLMTLAGLQIPAEEGTLIAIFEQVFADIGDEQDIQQSLSTFSAHLRNIVRIVETLGRSALVLLDEIGAGTDPAEGAAIAKALLDYLADRRARVVATTHYGELKEYAYSHAGVENASVEFNEETLSPTYRVLQGVPGSSNAFNIARRLGMPAEIVDGASGYLSRRDADTGAILQQIEKSRRAAAQAETDAAVARDRAQKAQAEYEERVQQVAEVQRTARNKAQDEAREVLRRAAEKAENILTDLQRLNRGTRKGPTVRQRLQSLRTETLTALDSGEAEASVPPFDPLHVYRRGDPVMVLALGTEGQLLSEPRGGSVEVQVGSMRALLPVEQLRPMQKAEAAERAGERSAERRKPSGVSDIAMRKSRHIAPELMLVSLRVDEAQSLLDKYVDDAYAAGIHQARIIHGKGTGALRRAVHGFLSGHPAIESFRLGEEGEGGEGATVVTFRS